VCLDILQNMDFSEVTSAGLSGHVENINLLSIVFGHGLRLSGHLAEDELSVTCVRTRLLAV
jgi:hypothetical protein